MLIDFDELHCFRCNNLTIDEDCRSVTKCVTNEICYVERSGHGNNKTMFTLGCIESQRCPSHQQFTIIGRAVQDQCLQCCSHDGCNKDLCEVQDISASTTQGMFEDDPFTYCSRLSQLVNICSDVHQAKQACKKYCGLCDLADGGWSTWSNYWSSCSASCGVGSKARRRSCTNPAPQHGGDNCTGDHMQVHSCFDRECPVHGEWSVWGGWEGCSVPCGTGINKRHRSCTNPAPTLYGHYCLGDPVEYDSCMGHACGNMTTTAPVASVQTPNCHDMLTDCHVLNKTTGVCFKDHARQVCPEFCGLCTIVHGNWSPWDTWTPCSSTCGQGITHRRRTCTSPRPSFSGNFCFSDPTETEMCSVRSCPVTGHWGEWSLWSCCSVSCGTGHTTRQRSCSNPRPAHRGLNCSGNRFEHNSCNAGVCPVNGGWSSWSSWSTCSRSCNSGERRRQRTCSNPSPVGFGRVCLGNYDDMGFCNNHTCPDDMKIPTIVFNAYFVTTLSPSNGQTMVFSSVISNIGSAYNSTTGTFTAPINGMYSFTAQLCVSNPDGRFGLVLDGNLVAGLYLYNYQDAATSSSTVPVFLKQGQKVWVRAYGCSSCFSQDSTCWNRFSGSLVHN